MKIALFDWSLAFEPRLDSRASQPEGLILPDREWILQAIVKYAFVASPYPCASPAPHARALATQTLKMLGPLCTD
eukprot:6208558-Pleurochrysis_carterae.AAC.5